MQARVKLRSPPSCKSLFSDNSLLPSTATLADSCTTSSMRFELLVLSAVLSLAAAQNSTTASTTTTSTTATSTTATSTTTTSSSTTFTETSTTFTESSVASESTFSANTSTSQTSTTAAPSASATKGPIWGPWCGCAAAPINCANSTETDPARRDCGPYVVRRQVCKAKVSKSSLLADLGGDNTTVVDDPGVDDDSDLVDSLSTEEAQEPPEPVMTDTELDVYKTMELELFSEFLKSSPMQSEALVDLPYCGLGPADTLASGRFKRSLIGDAFKNVKFLKDRPLRPACVAKTLSLKVHFNVITSNFSNDALVTESVLNTAVSELNAAYKPMYITFTRGVTTRKIATRDSAKDAVDYRKFSNNQRGTSSGEALTKAVMNNPALRYGGKDDLHVYVVEFIRNKNASEITNGFCNFPDSPEDGCAVTLDTLTDVSFMDCNTKGGTTLVHETGHWFGLRHTHDESENPSGRCKGNNGIAGYPQFPNANKFNSTQTPCPYGGKQGPPVFQNNYMSYTSVRGTGGYKPKVGPWVQAQRASAFTQFYHFRRGFKQPISCTGTPLLYPPRRRSLDLKSSPPLSLYKRLLAYRASDTYRKRGLLEQRPNLEDELKAICQTPSTGDAPDPVIASVIPDAAKDLRVAPEKDTLAAVDLNAGSDSPPLPIDGSGSGTGTTNSASGTTGTGTRAATATAAGTGTASSPPSSGATKLAVTFGLLTFTTLVAAVWL